MLCLGLSIEMFLLSFQIDHKGGLGKSRIRYIGSNVMLMSIQCWEPREGIFCTWRLAAVRCTHRRVAVYSAGEGRILRHTCPWPRRDVDAGRSGTRAQIQSYIIEKSRNKIQIVWTFQTGRKSRLTIHTNNHVARGGQQHISQGEEGQA